MTRRTCGSSGQSVLSGLRWGHLLTDQRWCGEEEGLGRRCEGVEGVSSDHMVKPGLIGVPCLGRLPIWQTGQVRSSPVEKDNRWPTLTFALNLAAILLCVVFTIKLKKSYKEQRINQSKSGGVSGPTQNERDHVSLKSSKCTRQQNSVRVSYRSRQTNFPTIFRHSNGFLLQCNEQDTHCRAGQLSSVRRGAGDSTAIRLFTANGACWPFTKSTT